ncbi:MAG: site-specific integrase, partial [Limisphaerales bacterium]
WEVARMLLATCSVVGDDAAESWRRLIKGLFVSGLRLEEAIFLTWQADGSFERQIWIDDSGKFPLLGIAAESEKGKQDRLLPITPDFGRFLLRTPKDERIGYVFPLVKKRHRNDRNVDHVSKVISAIGKASGVVVNSSGKFASAHDLRRSFGLRLAHKRYPAELQQLMRHEDISTTMKFYALVEATSFAERLWSEDGRRKPTPDTTPKDKT